MLSSIFKRIGIWKLSGILSISGIDLILGPFSNSTCLASSYGNGSSNKFKSIVGFFGSFTFGAFLPNVRGSVMTPVTTEAAAVTVPDKYTQYSMIPQRPGKVRIAVIQLLTPAAATWPVHI